MVTDTGPVSALSAFKQFIGIGAISKGVIGNLGVIKVESSFQIAYRKARVFYFFADLFEIYRHIIFKCDEVDVTHQIGFYLAYKRQRFSDFSVVRAHNEQVRPLTCSSALVNCAFATVTVAIKRMIYILREFHVLKIKF
jgi:hypothetical protein